MNIKEKIAIDKIVFLVYYGNIFQGQNVFLTGLFSGHEKFPCFRLNPPIFENMESRKPWRISQNMCFRDTGEYGRNSEFFPGIRVRV